jgi:hypothetical protein
MAIKKLSLKRILAIRAMSDVLVSKELQSDIL